MTTYDPILYGSSDLENIVNVSSRYGKIYIYREDAEGVHMDVHPYRPWVLANEALDDRFQELEGDNYFKYIRMFDNEKSWREFRRDFKHSGIWSPSNLVQMAMMTNGLTYHKGTKRKDVSTLSFDIETTGLRHDDYSKVLIISNTYRKGDLIVRKMFTLDEYRSQAEMIMAWCRWVKAMDPSVMVGHNIFSFDIPYMLFCAEKSGATLELGRDGSVLKLQMWESQFRVDQTRNIAYRMPEVFGREMVDTFFVAMKWDIGKKFSSYALKKIIAEAGLERTDRVMVNAGLIWKYWDNRFSNPGEWEDVKKYAEHDGDDGLAVYDLCADAFFYPCQNVPFTYERMCLSASGSQINAMFLRAYLNDGCSIPKPDEKKKFQGAISLGIPGTYRNCLAFDVNSLYPSVIIQYDVYDRVKDPKCYMLHMVKAFRKQRLEFKEKALTDDFYVTLDAVAKGFLNSFYGFCSTGGLHFNSQKCAEFITEKGREILETAIKWATGKNYEELLESSKVF
jgi:DNA polymerase I